MDEAREGKGYYEQKKAGQKQEEAREGRSYMYYEQKKAERKQEQQRLTSVVLSTLS